MEIYSSDNSESDEHTTFSRNKFNLSFTSIESDFLEEQLDLVSYNDSKDKTAMLLHYNNLTYIPENLSRFINLRKLDISNNRIHQLPDAISRLPLRTLIAKNNVLDENFLSVKSLRQLSNTLENLNLSGNNLSSIPEQVLQLTGLKYLYLGENRLQEIPHKVNCLIRLEILNVGGNQLSSVPSTVGQLSELRALILSDNQLDSLPASVANLKNLCILQLHKNKLRTLPTEIITLKNLSELSLRDNPLVVKFVSDMVYEPPTLQELSARTIKLYDIPYSRHDLPPNLFQFLSSAHHCLNPQCQGVFFDNRVEHVKFVDFCGKYRLPLLQYLCSSKCREDTNRQSHFQHHDALLRKVLLGN